MPGSLKSLLRCEERRSGRRGGPAERAEGVDVVGRTAGHAGPCRTWRPRGPGAARPYALTPVNPPAVPVVIFLLGGTPVLEWKDTALRRGAAHAGVAEAVMPAP